MIRTTCLSILIALTAWPADAEPAKPLMRDFMGINAHTVQFDAPLYAPLCRLVRDYHPFGWDVDGDTANDTTFPRSLTTITWKDHSGNFRPFSGQVDWGQMYTQWQAAGFEIDACIVFGNFKPPQWRNLNEDAYRYGKAFAGYFGPSHENIVTSVEIGNEPAGQDRFSNDQYMEVFTNMARGIREADPAMTIATCTAEAPPADGWSKSLDLFKPHGELYDVINLHKYAQAEGFPTWRRTYPEDPSLGYIEHIQRSIDWRDRHAPDKQIWITEFGYDATTKPSPEKGTFKKWRGVTDRQQARWIVRSYLCFAAMEMDRAYLYWFNDRDQPSVHAAAGVTRNYQPKPSYWAMRHLYRTLGDYRFTRQLQRDDRQAYVFEFTHGRKPDAKIVVAWSPTGDDREAELSLPLDGAVTRAQRMPLNDGDAPRVQIESTDDGQVTVPLTESPLYLFIAGPQ